nr:Late embryogenesis abundant protein [Ipomoea batatas]
MPSGLMERDQIWPLASGSDRPSSDDEESHSNTKEIHRKRLIRKCCGCAAALLLVAAALIVTLAFTVFKVKNPVITLNGVNIEKLEFVNGTSMPKPGSNMTLRADISVKNLNYASMEYGNTSSSLLYHGTVVGEARGPPGTTRARRTARMNITVGIMTDRIVSQPSLSGDMSKGMLTINSYTRVEGKVKFLKVIKKHLVVKMNCSVSLNVSSRQIQHQECQRRVQL